MDGYSKASDEHDLVAFLHQLSISSSSIPIICSWSHVHTTISDLCVSSRSDYPQPSQGWSRRERANHLCFHASLAVQLWIILGIQEPISQTIKSPKFPLSSV